MEIELQYFDGCPGWQEARTSLEAALLECGVSGEVRLRRLETSEEAVAARFRGSPTILLDGRDPFGADAGTAAGEPFGLMCRVYPTPEGLRDAPTVAQLVAALREHGGER